jgi:hypothetical protein
MNRNLTKEKTVVQPKEEHSSEEILCSIAAWENAEKPWKDFVSHRTNAC